MFILILSLVISGFYISALGRSLVERDFTIESEELIPDWAYTYIKYPLEDLWENSISPYFIGIRMAFDQGLRDAYVEANMEAIAELEAHVREAGKKGEDVDENL